MKRMLFICTVICLSGSLIALESAPSEVVGYVKYECVTTSTTDMNLVCIVFDNGITTAQDLAAAVGADGLVDAVSKWNPSTQSWDQVTYSQLPFPPYNWVWSDNFDVSNGDVLAVNVTADVDYYCAGAVGSDPVYNLVTTDATDANLIMLPLSESSLSNAQALANDIGAAGVVDAVSKWDPVYQSWNQVTYSQLPFPPYNWAWSDNFDIMIGEGYMVNMTENRTWPVIEFGDSINNKGKKQGDR